MCLITKSSKINIAKKSITVIKKVIIVNKTTWQPISQCFIKDTDGNLRVKRFLFNKILDAEDFYNNKIMGLKLTDWINGRKAVHEGFHAYTKPYYIYGYYDDNYKNYYKIAVIPKGAEYIISENDHEIVTNKIIVFSNKFRYTLYRLFGNMCLNF